MLEALVAPEVEHQLHGHNLTVGHGRLAAAALLPGGREEVFLKFCLEILAEFVNNTENYSNFVVGNHKAVSILVFCFSITKIQNFL